MSKSPKLGSPRLQSPKSKSPNLRKKKKLIDNQLANLIEVDCCYYIELASFQYFALPNCQPSQKTPMTAIETETFP